MRTGGVGRSDQLITTIEAIHAASLDMRNRISKMAQAIDPKGVQPIGHGTKGPGGSEKLFQLHVGQQFMHLHLSCGHG